MRRVNLSVFGNSRSAPRIGAGVRLGKPVFRAEIQPAIMTMEWQPGPVVLDAAVGTFQMPNASLFILDRLLRVRELTPVPCRYQVWFLSCWRRLALVANWSIGLRCWRTGCRIVLKQFPVGASALGAFVHVSLQFAGYILRTGLVRTHFELTQEENDLD